MDSTGPTRESGGTGAHPPLSAALEATLDELLSAALEATLDELREEITKHATDPSHDGRMPRLIHLVAQQARTDGLRAEQVVVALGEVWHNLPSGVWATPSMRAQVRWAVVSALITAYYEGDQGSAKPLA